MLYLRIFIIFFASTILSILNGNIHPYKKVIIWGHKLHTHTHSYVHNAFYRAFKSLGYETYWFDNNDNTKNFDFSNSIFLTEWQVDQRMPLRDDCFYMVHNMFEEGDMKLYEHKFPKYRKLWKQGKALNFRDYVAGKYNSDCVQFDTFSYTNLKKKTIYILWGTDLLPHEIDEMKKRVPLHLKNKSIYWVGTFGKGEGGNFDEIEGFKKACRDDGIQFIHRQSVSMEKNIELIQQSYMAPAIQGPLQVRRGYVPCRIFKNISYGHAGITNCPEVFDLFDRKIIFNLDTYQLYFDAKKKLQTITPEEIFEQMDYVKENHTYINRIFTLLAFMNLVQESSNKE